MEELKSEKILLKEYWNTLTPAQRKKLTSMLSEHGLPYNKAYRRINIIGFSLWEYDGIYNLLKDFGLQIPRSRTDVWNRIEKKEPFYIFMNNHGMSRGTTNTRFSRFKFKRWETKGIKEILCQFDNLKNNIS